MFSSTQSLMKINYGAYLHFLSKQIPETPRKKKTKMHQQLHKDGLRTTTTTSSRLRDQKVGDIMRTVKRRLVEVPYNASLADTMNALTANRVLAVPVAAPPGQWVGAGGSMIMESDKETGAVRKQYIGMVTMVDVLSHIAGDEDSDLEKKMSVYVSSIIGHCLEGLSLWTLNPNTSVLDCMEVFSKGIHRALVPIDGQAENISGAELVESAPIYRMLTQMDLMKFLKENASEFHGILSRKLSEIGAVNESVYAISSSTKVIDAIKCMRASLLNAVPIVVASNSFEEQSMQLIDGRGKKVIGTFSATDLRGCHFSSLKTWLPVSALEFTEMVSLCPINAAPNPSNTSPRELVTCNPESFLSEVIDKVVTKHVHRIWVVDQQGLLVGLVSLTDIIRVIRASLLTNQDV